MTEPTKTNVPHALSWAAYLGASWTWVIGMFLPILLVRDFGPLAWFVFAIPNVLGAAAMGWTIRSREQSAAFVANHRVACQAFSLVTIAFHVYVMLWLVPKLVGPLPASIAFGAALVVLVPLFTTTIHATTLAIAALVASVLIAMTMLGLGALAWPATHNTQSGFDLAALGVVCLLGFLTCPYLDLTFHRARQACATPAESRVAFGIGFGVCFCAMIVFTLFYATVLLSGVDDRIVRATIGTHLCLQSIFTLAIHASSFRAASIHPAAASRALTVAIATAVIFALVALLFESRAITVGSLRAGEVVYRSFLAFYGVIAPAYIWICLWHADAPPERTAVRNAAIVVLIAVPFFWIGFMHASMRWALPGVGALFLGWIATSLDRHANLARDRAFRSIAGRPR